jgi:hypothetical protein
MEQHGRVYSGLCKWQRNLCDLHRLRKGSRWAVEVLLQRMAVTYADILWQAGWAFSTSAGPIKPCDSLSDTFGLDPSHSPQTDPLTKNFYIEKCKKGGMPESTLPQTHIFVRYFF